jgi:HEAT repeat protein
LFCFFLARSLGNLDDPRPTNAFVTAHWSNPRRRPCWGFPDPLTPDLLFLHNDPPPCWRAATAWALGRIGDPRALPALLKTIADLRNAIDTRYAAAEALAGMTDAGTLATIRQLAADYPEVSTQRALLEICSRADVPRLGGDQ